MKHSYLLKRLVLPLLVATGVALGASLVVIEPWKGLLVNLAATFVGSIITVFYIDAALRHSRELEWVQVRSLVNQRVARMANICVTSTRVAFGFDTRLYERGVLESGDVNRAQEEIIRIAENALIPGAQNVEKMDGRAWQIYFQSLRGVTMEVDRLLNLFAPNFDPALTQMLLEIQSAAERVCIPYLTFPDVLGVAPHELTPLRNGTSSIPLQQRLNVGAAQDIAELLRITLRLLKRMQESIHAI